MGNDAALRSAQAVLVVAVMFKVVLIIGKRLKLIFRSEAAARCRAGRTQ